MEVRQFTSLESQFLNELNKLEPAKRTFDELKNHVSFSEKILKDVIETMIAKNVLKFNPSTKCYFYDTPVEGDKVVLDGNILLPTTIIKTDTQLLISRGQWYSFPLDFDPRRIIWNVKLTNNSNKSTLMDLVKESALKERKARIEQVPAYSNLVNKLVPFNKNIKLKLNAIGEEHTDVNIIFLDFLSTDGDTHEDSPKIEFRDFSVRSIIKTDELIEQLQLGVEVRDFSKININRIFNFTDFVFSGNSIPYASDVDTIQYVKITGIKGKFEITFYTMDFTGKTVKDDVESYVDVSEGIDRLRGLFGAYAKSLCQASDFLIDTAE